MKNLISVFAILSFIFLLAENTFAASFDCSKTSTETEKIICQNDELSALDELMFAVYKQALRSNDWMYFEEDRDDSTLIAAQRNSISKQVKCGLNVKCLKNFYSERITELLKISGVYTENYVGNPVLGLLKFKAELQPNMDLLAFASSSNNSVEVLLTALSDPANISRANTGTVYNSNPTTLHVRYTTENGNYLTQELAGPDFTSQQTTLTASGLNFEIMQEHTRGWSTTTYERDWETWELAFEERNEVVRPASGLDYYNKTDHNIGVTYSRYSYVFLDCGVTDHPELIGSFKHVSDYQGYDRDFISYYSEYDDIKANRALQTFLAQLSDEYLHRFAVHAFSESNFYMAKFVFELLSSRNFSQSAANLECVKQAIEENR